MVSAACLDPTLPRLTAGAPGTRIGESQCILPAEGGRGASLVRNPPDSALTHAQLKLRLKTLLDKKRMMQARNTAAPKISASFITLEEGFQQFGTDLSKLQVCGHLKYPLSSY